MKVKQLLRQFALLLLTFLQSVICAIALAVFITVPSSPGELGAGNIYLLCLIELLLVSLAYIPAKAALRMKSKILDSAPSPEVYFDNSEGRVKAKDFYDYREKPMWQTLVWYLLGLGVFFIQLIAVLVCLISLLIPVIHSEVGNGRWTVKCQGLQNCLFFLFNFFIGGVANGSGE